MSTIITLDSNLIPQLNYLLDERAYEAIKENLNKSLGKLII